MSGWTPGPWVATEYNDGDSRPEWLIQAPRPGTPARPWVGTIDKRADACLIAAAPELAEFIDRVCNLEGLSVDGREGWVIAGRALLAQIGWDEHELEKQFPDGDSASFR